MTGLLILGGLACFALGFILGICLCASDYARHTKRMQRRQRGNGKSS